MSMLLDHDATAARRLAHLTIIVDGAGPAVDAVDRAARGVGMTRLVSGAYAAEPAHWTGPPAPAAIVFVGQGPLQAAVAAPWWRAGVVHLPLRLDGASDEIGPLVVPGVSSCVGCHERLRARSGPREHPAPGTPDPPTVHLAAAVAALTLRRTLLGDHDLAGVSSEVVEGRPEVRHRHWPRHPECGCGTLAAHDLRDLVPAS